MARSQRLNILWSVDFIDHGSRQLLEADRKLRTQAAQSTRTLQARDRAIAAGARSSRAAAGAQGQVATGAQRAAGAQRAEAAAARASGAAHKGGAVSATRTARSYDQITRSASQAERAQRRATAAARAQARGSVSRGASTLGFFGAFGIAGAIRQTVEFDRAMRNVNSIAQLSEKRFSSLSKEVRELGARTAQSPRTLAEGLYDLVSSGFNAQQSMKILASSARAATAGLTTTEVSTKAVAAVLNAYHRPAKDAREVTNDLFQTVNLGVVRFEELAETIGDVLPFAAQLGIGLKAVGAATTTMTKAGIGVPETMTRIKNVMVSLLKPGEDLKKAYKELGVESGQELIKKMGGGTVGFQRSLEAIVNTTLKADDLKKAYRDLGVSGFDQLTKKTGGTSKANAALARELSANGSEVAKLFPNIRSLGGALALTGANTRGAEKDLAGFRDTSGAVLKVTREQMKSTAKQWDLLKANLENLGIAAGAKVLPVVNEVITGMVTLGHEHPNVLKLAAAFAAIAISVKAIRFTSALLGITDLIRAARSATMVMAGMRAGATLGESVAGARAGAAVAAPGVLGRAKARISAAILPTALQTAPAAAAAAPAVVAPAGRAARIVPRLARGVGPAALVGGTAAAIGGSAIGGETGARVANIGGMVATGAALGSVVPGVGTAIGAGVGAAAGVALDKQMRTAIVGVLRKGWRVAVGAAFGPAGAVVGAVLTPRIREAIGGALAAAGGQIAEWAGSIGGFFAPAARAVAAVAGPIAAPFATAFRSAFNAARAAIGVGFKIWRTAFLVGFAAIYLIGRTAFRPLIAVVTAGVRAFSAVSRPALRAFSAVFTAAFRGLGAVVRIGVGAAGRAWSAIKSVFAGPARAAVGAARAALGGLAGVAKATAGRAARVAGGAWDIVSTLTRPARRAVGAVLSTLGGLAGKAASAMGRVVSRIAGAMGTLPGKIKGALSGLGGVLGGIGRSIADWLNANTPLGDKIDLGITSITLPSLRGGGMIRAADAAMGGDWTWPGLVDVLVSPGEVGVLPTGTAFRVPGASVAADTVPMRLPDKTRILTGHGQQLVAAGASIDEAVDQQLPHFRGGGTVVASERHRTDRTTDRRSSRRSSLTERRRFMDERRRVSVLEQRREHVVGRRDERGVSRVSRLVERLRIGGLVERFQRGGKVTEGRYVSTAYGPPWGGIQGTGVTKTGIDLKRAPHRYLVAVDPSVIALHSKVRIQPNPFRHRGAFQAEDIGGAIKGRRIDFYDWRGRSSQLRWGRRPVRVRAAAAAGGRRERERSRTRLSFAARPPSRVRSFAAGYQAGLDGTRLWDTETVRQGVQAATVRIERTVAAPSRTSSRRGSRGLPADIARAQRWADATVAKRYPYVYGGGHGAIGQPSGGGYDCSGLVSGAIGAARLASAPMATDGLKSWGVAGDGRHLTVGVRGSTGRSAHAAIKIGRNVYESGGSGGGPHRLSSWPGTFPIHRRPARARAGGQVAQGTVRRGRRVLSRAAARIARVLPALIGAPVEKVERAADPRSPTFVGWGLRGGGVATTTGPRTPVATRRTIDSLVMVGAPRFRNGGRVDPAEPATGRGTRTLEQLIPVGPRAFRAGGRVARFQHGGTAGQAVGPRRPLDVRIVEDRTARAAAHVRVTAPPPAPAAVLIRRLERAGGDTGDQRRLLHRILEHQQAIARLVKGGVTRQERPQLRRLQGEVTTLVERAQRRYGLRVAPSPRHPRGPEAQPERGPTATLLRGLRLAPVTANAKVKSLLRAYAKSIERVDTTTLAILQDRLGVLESGIRPLRQRLRRQGGVRQLRRLNVRERRLERGGVEPSERQALRRVRRRAAPIRRTVRELRAERGEARQLRSQLDEPPSFRGLQRQEGQIERRIRQVRRGGVRGRGERVELRRLQGALTVVQTEMGRRVGLIVQGVEQQGQALERARNNLSRSLRVRGIDEASARGQAELAAFSKHSIDVLRGQADDLELARRRAVRAGDATAVRDISERLGAVRESIADAAVDWIEQARAAAAAAAQERLDTVEFGHSLASGLQESFELDQRLAGTFDTGAAARAENVKSVVIPSIEAQLKEIRSQFLVAVMQGNTELARSLVLQLVQGGNDIKTLLTDIKDSSAETAENTEPTKKTGNVAFERGGQIETDVLVAA